MARAASGGRRLAARQRDLARGIEPKANAPALALEIQIIQQHAVTLGRETAGFLPPPVSGKIGNSDLLVIQMEVTGNRPITRLAAARYCRRRALAAFQRRR
jgi:hypothetical protein